MRGTVAIDMEGAAFCRTMASYPEIRWLIVKGVSDYADSDKDDAYHQYASSASAQYLLSFLKEYVTQDHIPGYREHQSLSGESPATIWNVPYLRNQFFTGRENVLGQLHELLQTTQAAALTQQHIISGLGGIGKTQIALEYAHRYHGEYKAVLWVRADTRDTIMADFVKIASLIHLPESNEQDQAITVNAVRQWLAKNSAWLLILDNAEDLELVNNFIPTAGNVKGHTIIITRAYATGRIAKSIVLEKMTQDEGFLLFLRRAKILDQVTEMDRSKVEAIITELDGLPLALDQAGAYIEETGCSVSDYFDLYQSHRAALLRERGSFAPDHPDSVSTTFSLAFQKVQETSSSAAEILRLCTFLHPDVIPEEIFTDYAPKLDASLQPLVATQLELNAAIKTLLKFSLVQRNTEIRALTIHRLVQAVLQDEMDEQTRCQWGGICSTFCQSFVSLFQFRNMVKVPTVPSTCLCLYRIHCTKEDRIPGSCWIALSNGTLFRRSRAVCRSRATFSGSFGDQ